MVTRLLLLYLLTVCVTCEGFKDDNSTAIFVHPSKGNDSRECYNPSTASKNRPCRTLRYALEHLQDSTQVVLISSNETYLVNSGMLKVEDKTQFSLEGQEIASIECTDNSGFAFSNILQLYLLSLRISGCGTLQSSTSKNYSEGANTTTSFLVAVYVNSCAKVTIDSVNITKSEGTAVTMYNCGSQVVSVTKSLFADNNGTGTPNYGGGFYIEFTYCEPGVVDCDNKTFTKNSHNLIMFDSCEFSNNAAIAESVNTSFIVPRGNNHAAFGRGGGLSFYFKCSAQNNTVKISDCRFVNNSAKWGGGLFVEFDDTAVSNVFEVQSSDFEGNTCHYTSDSGTGGGGMRIGHYVFTHVNSSLIGNIVHIQGCNFSHNSAMHGGGISLSPTLIEAYSHRAIPQVVISNCHFYKNTAKLGAAFESTLFPLFLDGSGIKLSIVRSTFVKNKVKYLDSSQYQLGIGAVYLNGVSAFFNSTLDFDGNRGSAIAAITCYVDFSDCLQASFRNNIAELGGAIALLGNAVIQVGQKTYLLFENNHATRHGGAIHNVYIGYQNSVTYTKCFIKHAETFIPSTDWTSRLSFINNTAKFRGQAIYSSSVLPCAWAGKYGYNNNLPDFFCRWHFVGKNGSGCIDQIETLANRVSSNNSWHANAFPGQQIHLNIDVTDDLGHSMSDNVVFIAQVPEDDNSDVQVSPPFQYVTNQSIVFTGNSKLNNSNQTVHLELNTVFERSWHINYTINLFECPLGYKLQPSKTFSGYTCICDLSSTFKDLIWCNSDPLYTVYIANKHWIGQISGTALYMGACPSGYCSLSLSDEGYVLPLISGSSDLDYNHAICSGANRTGVLCGSCIDDYSIAFGTNNFQCVNCTNSPGLNIALYILGNYAPVAILFIFIIVFNIRLTSGAAVSFIFFCQVVGAGKDIIEDSEALANKAGVPGFVDLLYRVPFSVLNLKFLFLQLFNVHVCFHNFNALDIVQLDALVALSPLLMIIVIIVAMKLKDCCTSRSLCYQLLTFCHNKCQCCFRKRRNVKLSLLHAFAAFILLSYNTFCLTATTVLSRAGLFNSSGKYTYYVSKYAGHIFTDQLIEYQLRYALPAYIVILVFIIPAPLILLGFPVRLFERCIVTRSGCIRRYYPADKIAIFLDTFQGCYRDNMRFFAGLYLVCRLAVFLTASLATTVAGEYSIKTIIFLILLIFVAICQPYREKFLNVVDTLILANLTAITTLRSYLAADLYSEPGVYWIGYFLIILPVIYMLGYLVWSLLRPYHKKIKDKITTRLGQKRSQILFDVTVTSSTKSHPSDDSDDEVEQLLKRAEIRNNYYPSSTDCSMDTDHDENF